MSFKVKNIFAFLYKTLVDITIYSLVLATVLAFLPNGLFKDFPLEPKSYELNFPEKLENWNNFLNTKSELLLKGKISGPESLAEQGAFIYSGLSDGRLVEINKKTLKIRDVAKFGSGNICENSSECGRVLGLRFHRDRYLYGVDYYNGLFRVNVSTGQKEYIPVVEDKIIGYDDLEFDSELNVVYISIFSSKWKLNQILWALLDHDDTGYVLAFNLDTKTSVKLKTGMFLANGLQLSKDKKHLLIAEFHRYRIWRAPIKALHSALQQNRLLTDSEIEIFAELPGEPENIRLDPNGDILVPTFTVRTDGKIFVDYLSEWPFIRKAIARTQYCFAVAFDFMNTNLIEIKSMKKMVSDLYRGEYISKYLPKTSSILKLDAKSGQIKQILGSELFNGVTEALIDSEGDLYFGNFNQPFVGRIKKGQY